MFISIPALLSEAWTIPRFKAVVIMPRGQQKEFTICRASISEKQQWRAFSLAEHAVFAHQLNCIGTQQHQRRKSDGVSLCLSPTRGAYAVSLPVAPFRCQPTVVCQRLKQARCVGWSRKGLKLGDRGGFGGVGWEQEEGWLGREERGRGICPWACFVLS